MKEKLIEPTPLKMISWNASDNGNNDDYDSYYAYDCIYSIDNGASSSITEEEVIERFIERSMKVLTWKEKYNLEKFDWKLVKKNEGEYVIKYWRIDYVESDASTLTRLNFTTENVFQLI